MNFATVHLFRGSDLKNYNTDQVPAKEQLDNSYPGFTTKLRSGDILENVEDSGYRSEGIYMWNGTDVIRQNTEYDDYGSPAKEFKVITQFPPNYWGKDLIHRDMSIILMFLTFVIVSFIGIVIPHPLLLI